MSYLDLDQIPDINSKLVSTEIYIYDGVEHKVYSSNYTNIDGITYYICNVCHNFDISKLDIRNHSLDPTHQYNQKNYQNISDLCLEESRKQFVHNGELINVYGAGLSSRDRGDMTMYICNACPFGTNLYRYGLYAHSLTDEHVNGLRTSSASTKNHKSRRKSRKSSRKTIRKSRKSKKRKSLKSKKRSKSRR